MNGKGFFFFFEGMNGKGFEAPQNKHHG